ncbi:MULTISPECIES: septum formation family protein [unclassified Tsukamurella]|uniref:septum formation family protein n=2 Tax=Tsukamurella TaxID=2060 RepID=UPI003015F398
MADDTETQPAPAAKTGRAGALTVRAVLAAVVVGALAIGGILFATGAFEPKNEEKAPRLAAAGTTLARSKPGTCLTWDKDPSTMAPVDCVQPHKFEVAGEPARTLPENAPYPSATALAAQRDQLCPPVVTEYLGTRLDPMGRFQMGLLTAGEKAWESGDRTMRCGVQVVDGAGNALENQGKIVNQDKSLTWPPGTCIGIDDRGQRTAPVACTQPHAFEVTAVIDMRQAFPDASWPTERQQEDYLSRICPSRTTGWFGSQDGLRKSGLQLAWNKLSQPSWTAGSRSVICFLASSKDARTFTPITGSAKSPDLLIDGKKPVMPTFPGAGPAPTPAPGR